MRKKRKWLEISRAPGLAGRGSRSWSWITTSAATPKAWPSLMAVTIRCGIRVSWWGDQPRDPGVCRRCRHFVVEELRTEDVRPGQGTVDPGRLGRRQQRSFAWLALPPA